MAKGNTILQTTNLSIGYDRALGCVASGINLALKAGELIALIGLNGAGKSTLLRTITGIQKPLSGNIMLNNKPLDAYSQPQLATAMSLVLTESLPPSNLTVYELVALGRQPYTNWLSALSENDKQAITHALELTRTTHLAHKKHYEISDGQLQKVLIARALAQDTPLIILDEPTTHLDILHKASLLKLLKKMAAETGKCIFYSTHDVDLALQLSDSLAVITNSKLIQDTPQNLVNGKILDTLFNDEDIEFDAQRGTFVVR